MLGCKFLQQPALAHCLQNLLALSSVTERLLLSQPCQQQLQQLQQLQNQQQQQQQQSRGKHTVRMVLLKDHQRLGQAGDIVKVKAGHARYILFPRGEADYAVPSVLRQLKDQGLLTPAALEMMANGFKEQQGAAAGALDLSTLPVEQQLPRIVQLLSDSTITISRRFNLHQADQPMLGQVTARQLSAYVAQQLKVLLPEELILMHKHDPITQFGAYKVPLNLKDADGNQVELGVVVQKTLRPNKLRSRLQQLGMLQQQQQQQQQH